MKHGGNSLPGPAPAHPAWLGRARLGSARPGGGATRARATRQQLARSRLPPPAGRGVPATPSAVHPIPSESGSDSDREGYARRGEGERGAPKKMINSCIGGPRAVVWGGPRGDLESQCSPDDRNTSFIGVVFEEDTPPHLAAPHPQPGTIGLKYTGNPRCP